MRNPWGVQEFKQVCASFNQSFICSLNAVNEIHYCTSWPQTTNSNDQNCIVYLKIYAGRWSISYIGARYLSEEIFCKIMAKTNLTMAKSVLFLPLFNSFFLFLICYSFLSHSVGFRNSGIFPEYILKQSLRPLSFREWKRCDNRADIFSLFQAANRLRLNFKQFKAAIYVIVAGTMRCALCSWITIETDKQVLLIRRNC